MTTSGSTDFSITRDDLITDILIELGVLKGGGTADAADVTLVARRLNMYIKSLPNYGVQAYARRTSLVTNSLTEDKATYTLGESGADVTMPKPLDIVQAYVRDDEGDDYMCRIITRDEYESLYDKDTSGQPYKLYYEADAQNESSGSPFLGKVHLWPVTDASTAGWDLYIVFTRPLEDFDASTDTPDVPQAWYQALFRVMVYQMAPAFGREATDDMKALASEDFARAIGNFRETPQEPMFGWPNGPEPKWDF